MEKYRIILQMHEAMCFVDVTPDFTIESPDDFSAKEYALQLIEHWEKNEAMTIGFDICTKKLVSKIAPTSGINHFSYKNFAVFDESKYMSCTTILPEHLKKVNQQDFVEVLFQRCSARNTKETTAIFECIAFAVERI